ncbi:MAG TPA: hypothetical protein VMJ73_08965 [Rhizomicrobium sp.]|jgi:hypothetical protein|nr:hypothetical protein [Rhizomicrobium sp.]
MSLADNSQQARPSGLRDLQRDWQRWSLGERIAMALVASTFLTLLSLIR